MRVAFCVAVKNRSCCIVDPEDSLKFLQHVHDKIVDCPQLQGLPLQTRDGRHILLLLPHMIRSLIKQKRASDDWVLIVVDYGSTDVDMKAMMKEECDGKIEWHLESVKDYPFFDRGGGLAKGAKIAETLKANAVFFCDADLEFQSRELFDEMYRSLALGNFFYPIFFSFAVVDHSKGLWRDTSFGNFACLLKDYKETEGWYHNISWGWEDRALSDSILEHRKDRKRIEGFFHQWHPLQWEFRVREYPVKHYIFKDAAVKEL